MNDRQPCHLFIWVLQYVMNRGDSSFSVPHRRPLFCRRRSCSACRRVLGYPPASPRSHPSRRAYHYSSNSHRRLPLSVARSRLPLRTQEYQNIPQKKLRRWSSQVHTALPESNAAIIVGAPKKYQTQENDSFPLNGVELYTNMDVIPSLLKRHFVNNFTRHYYY